MQKILIANRGEIALRIIKTCKALGIETVAIYSEADEGMPFVIEADQAFLIGPPPVNQSYLNVEKIIQIALAEKVDAIHPGYGFLSENADFARKIHAAGIIFIGPNPDTIEKMGDKIISRQTMEKAGVPIVPGSHSGVVTVEAALALAETYGYPIMLKASGGGGGIGMVRCETEQALKSAFTSTKSRAKAYFGSDEVFVEKCIEGSRHIEVQIFGDDKGQIVSLFERDCSIQRRHQKVIEESPSPSLSMKTREKMLETAIKAGEAVGYKNAGTVEFIVDADENFYFLEMNTRLQVEHPVTEQITGIDLVEWQIGIAKGKELPLKQSEIKSVGHAMEFRLYAEDPVTFMPSPGTISQLKWGNPDGVRIDYGYVEGSKVTPFYDPMIAKCIITGENREETLQKAAQFFEELEISGIKTNAPLFVEILDDQDFSKGQYTTDFLKNKSLMKKQ
ncbi:acetyl-CoA carboxylase biotin carboxylase subunit [Cytobacillus sp. Sa5YUA1]|uniref:Acetyl-CoA carboxylase biotin carboxylase subunit n=1 Tax=Cytobacillus stercorigallinarum TaxID=2762240 RepID=A0ABR8QMV3_9BACI|nr:acetyl-CoA carboxylase biotin carboxylase subunit [Cytobacillus stercorigallinarum]MBD7936830.1 acetyl-CoA carboxylase biotin carboxylase subunit [Cytobacillus stercorigallinarum]